MTGTQILPAEAFSILFQKLTQHLELFLRYKECLERAFTNILVSLQFTGDGRLVIIRMKVFSVRHAFVVGNSHSATAEKHVCVFWFFFFLLMFLTYI